MWHVLILISEVLFAVYQFVFEDKLLIEKSIRILDVSIFVGAAGFATFHHRHFQQVVNFLNEILLFEKRRVRTDKNFDAEFWRKHVAYRKFVIVGLELYRLFLFLISITIATSLALYPYSPWKKLPARTLQQLINSIPILAGNPIYTDAIVRVISFTYTYVVMRLFLNHILLVITLALTAAQSSMFWMLVALKRLIIQYSRFGREEKVGTVIKMFREIQLLRKVYNDIHKLHLVLATIIIFGMAGSCSLFVVVSRWEMLDFQGMVIYGGDGLVTCVAVILHLFHIAVKIYAESQNVLGYNATCCILQFGVIRQDKDMW